MFHWPNNIQRLFLPAGSVHKLRITCCCTLWVLGIFACGFADLRPVGVTVTPGEYDTVLPGEYTPVILGFDTEMQKYETEGILQISSDMGTIEGDRFWKGNELYFTPLAGWTAGVRYTLSLSGMIRSLDGRELRLERFITFYAINKYAPPLVEWYSPADGASVGTGNITIELLFSQPMERLSVESAFTLEGAGTKNFEWLADDTVLKVIPQKDFSAWTSYRWNLKSSAKSRDGVPLAKAVSARFSTDLDQLLPRVSRVFPALNSGGRWLATGESIENGLGPGQGIVVEFNKPMGENVLRSLRFDPSLAGRTEALSDKSVIFIPSRDPEPEMAYTLIVSADTKDSEGLKLGEDFSVCFIPDIPFMKILSIGVDGIPALDTSDRCGDLGSVLAVPVNPSGGELIFTIWFSLPFSAGEKQNAALKIFLNPFFPRSLESVALHSITWLSDDLLRMKWEGLEAGKSGETHYYKLLIPGGKGGINNGGGMYLKEDQYIYLEAIK